MSALYNGGLDFLIDENTSDIDTLMIVKSRTYKNMQETLPEEIVQHHHL